MTKLCVTCEGEGISVKATKTNNGKFYCNEHFTADSISTRNNVCVVDSVTRATYGIGNMPTHCNLCRTVEMHRC